MERSEGQEKTQPSHSDNPGRKECTDSPPHPSPASNLSSGILQPSSCPKAWEPGASSQGSLPYAPPTPNFFCRTASAGSPGELHKFSRGPAAAWSQQQLPVCSFGDLGCQLGHWRDLVGRNGVGVALRRTGGVSEDWRSRRGTGEVRGARERSAGSGETRREPASAAEMRAGVVSKAGRDRGFPRIPWGDSAGSLSCQWCRQHGGAEAWPGFKNPGGLGLLQAFPQLISALDPHRPQLSGELDSSP